MIRGIVTQDREAIVRLTVLGQRRRKCGVEAVVDTGFDGYLSLPPALIARLKLPWLKRGMAELADGSVTPFDVYSGSVIWDGREHAIAIDEADTAPLVGMSLLNGYELRVEAWPGGAVSIRRPRRK